jgi:short-chain fatty acids transporter
MLAAFGRRLERIFSAVVPEPFVLAILLTALVGAAGLLATGGRVEPVLEAWTGPRGIWSLLRFSMQMCLVLVTGHAVASSPPMGRLLRSVAELPRSGGQAAAVVAIGSMLLGLTNWGLGLVGGALLARFVGASCAARGVPAHGPLLAACGYAAMVIWHGGFSGSAPLKVTTRDDLVRLLGPDLGSSMAVVPTTETLLGPLNLLVVVGLLLSIPLVALRLAPATAEPLAPPDVDDAPAPVGLAGSRWVTVLLVVPLALAQVQYFASAGVSRLDPNAVNALLLTLGLVLHGTPGAYALAIQRAVGGCAGIILQFPLYGGIMGMMAGTGLASALARLAVRLEGSAFLVGTFLSAGLLNLFVPSGGGQWAVQGPIVVEAAQANGVAVSSVVMAVAYGDQWTNMLQPFWALPLLGLTGVRAGPMLGYTFVFLLVSGAWFAGCLWFIG